jgi:hypothetical protein
LWLLVEVWCFRTAQGVRTKAHEFISAGLDRNLTASFTGDKAAASVMLIGTIVDATRQMGGGEAGVCEEFEGNLDCCC